MTVYNIFTFLFFLEICICISGVPSFQLTESLERYDPESPHFVLSHVLSEHLGHPHMVNLVQGSVFNREEIRIYSFEFSNLQIETTNIHKEQSHSYIRYTIPSKSITGDINFKWEYLMEELFRSKGVGSGKASFATTAVELQFSETGNISCESVVQLNEFEFSLETESFIKRTEKGSKWLTDTLNIEVKKECEQYFSQSIAQHVQAFYKNVIESACKANKIIVGEQKEIELTRSLEEFSFGESYLTWDGTTSISETKFIPSTAIEPQIQSNPRLNLQLCIEFNEESLLSVVKDSQVFTHNIIFQKGMPNLEGTFPFKKFTIVELQYIFPNILEHGQDPFGLFKMECTPNTLELEDIFIIEKGVLEIIYNLNCKVLAASTNESIVEFATEVLVGYDVMLENDLYISANVKEATGFFTSSTQTAVEHVLGPMIGKALVGSNNFDLKLFGENFSTNIKMERASFTAANGFLKICSENTEII